MDTIFASSPPPTDSERVNRVKSKTKKRSSPRRRRQFEQQQESTDQETLHDTLMPMPSMRNSSSIIIDSVTGNISRVPDSVIVNIDTSSETSSSIDDDRQEDDIEIDDDIHEGKTILFFFISSRISFQLIDYLFCT